MALDRSWQQLSRLLATSEIPVIVSGRRHLVRYHVDITRMRLITPPSPLPSFPSSTTSTFLLLDVDININSAARHTRARNNALV